MNVLILHACMALVLMGSMSSAVSVRHLILVSSVSKVTLSRLIDVTFLSMITFRILTAEIIWPIDFP